MLNFRFGSVEIRVSVGCVICVEFDWYPKRVGLAMVYTSAEVYMVQDSSQEFENTWKFLDRQLACYMWLGQCVSEVRTIYDGTWILALGVACDFDYSCESVWCNL